jgi:hypothetical protein
VRREADKGLGAMKAHGNSRQPADIYSAVLFIGAVAAVWGGALWVAIMVALD